MSSQDLPQELLSQIATEWIGLGLRTLESGFVPNHQQMREDIDRVYTDAGLKEPDVIVIGTFPEMVKRTGKFLLEGYVEERYGDRLHSFKAPPSYQPPPKSKLSDIRNSALFSGQFSADTGALIYIDRLLTPDSAASAKAEGLYRAIQSCGPGFMFENAAFISVSPSKITEHGEPNSNGLKQLKVEW